MVARFSRVRTCGTVQRVKSVVPVEILRVHVRRLDNLVDFTCASGCRVKKGDEERYDNGSSYKKKTTLQENLETCPK
ncbi:hypothetical protein V1477_003305 [Vespula maculifrons]|uniref:Uncharacterized protein n=1 Tax=Vespula maculifrons TaxID=7453 RepID=A0ABD2CU55_VESMC